MTVEEALLAEFDEDDPQVLEPQSSKERTDIASDGRPEAHLTTMNAAVSGSATMTPMFKIMSLVPDDGPSNSESGSNGGKDIGRAPILSDEQLAAYSRYPAREPIDRLPMTINSGFGLVALFGEEKIPRTIYTLIVEDRTDIYYATAYLPARLTLAQICQEYPQFVRGTILRMFVREGWTAEDIWNNISDGVLAGTADHSYPWSPIQANIDKEIQYMVANDDYASEDEQEVIYLRTPTPDPASGDSSLEAGSSSSPSTGSSRKVYKLWTEEETNTLINMKNEGESWADIDNVIKRGLIAIKGKWASLRKRAAKERAEAEDADQARPGTTFARTSPASSSPVQKSHVPTVPANYDPDAPTSFVPAVRKSYAPAPKQQPKSAPPATFEQQAMAAYYIASGIDPTQSQVTSEQGPSTPRRARRDLPTPHSRRSELGSDVVDMTGMGSQGSPLIDVTGSTDNGKSTNVAKREDSPIIDLTGTNDVGGSADDPMLLD